MSSSGIYELVNTENGKKYIGQSTIMHINTGRTWEDVGINLKGDGGDGSTDDG